MNIKNKLEGGFYMKLPQYIQEMFVQYINENDDSMNLDNYIFTAMYEKLQKDLEFMKKPCKYAYMPKTFINMITETNFKDGVYINDMPVPLHTSLKYVTYSELNYPFEVYRVELQNPIDYEFFEEIISNKKIEQENKYYDWANDWDSYSYRNKYARNCIYTNKFKLLELVKQEEIFKEFYKIEKQAINMSNIVRKLYNNCIDINNIIKNVETTPLAPHHFKLIDESLYKFIKLDDILRERFALQITEYEENMVNNKFVDSSKRNFYDKKDTFFATYNCSFLNEEGIIKNYDNELRNLAYELYFVAESISRNELFEDDELIKSYLLSILLNEKNTTEKYSHLVPIKQLGYYINGIDKEKNLIVISPMYPRNVECDIVGKAHYIYTWGSKVPKQAVFSGDNLYIHWKDDLYFFVNNIKASRFNANNVNVLSNMVSLEEAFGVVRIPKNNITEEES